MIEILVAIVLFALLTAAAVPLYITALRASVVTKLDTTAKNLSQDRIEAMRNLPFRVGYDSTVTTSVDLLDVYYPNLAAAAGISSGGLVSATDARNAGEPNGSFYRRVEAQTVGGKSYTQYVATQFLSPDTRAPVVPAAPYDTASLNDLSPSTLVGVSLITEWSIGTLSKRFSVYTEFGDVPPNVPLVSLQARATALKVSSTMENSVTQDLLLELGAVNIDGEVASGTTAGASSSGGSASLVPGTGVSGADNDAAAPPDATAAAATMPSQDLRVGGQLVARIPRTDVDGFAVSTSSSEPRVGSSGVPLSASSVGNVDTQFSNLPNLSDPALGIGGGLPVVTQPATGSTVQARARGWATTTSGSAHSGTTSVSALTDTVRVLPTSFSPEGIVQLRLLSASLTCVSSAATPTATAAYSAELRVRIFIPNILTSPLAGGTYVWTPLTPLSGSQVTDPLAAFNLTVGPGGLIVGVNNGRFVYLGEYVSTMSSLTASGLAAAVTTRPSGKGLESRPTGVVTVSTVPLRQGEDLSSVTIALGSLSCVSEDVR